MKRILLCMAVVLALAACEQSYEEQKRMTRAQKRKLWQQDSAAMKIAVMPTLDCLPLFLAKDHGLFEKHGVDIRLKRFTAQMDCDTAIERGRVEAGVTDLVRAERMKNNGTPLQYVTATNAYWQLYTNRNARIRELKQLDDKMLAMTRYSVTDMLTDLIVDSAKLQQERLFRIQVNDVTVRISMLLGNEMDAMLLTEPQATQARLARHNMLLDTRKLDIQMGVLAVRESQLKDSTRRRQLDVLKRVYNQACDSLNQRGISFYRDLVAKYCYLKPSVVDSLPRLKFPKVAAPRPQDVERAQKWIKK